MATDAARYDRAILTRDQDRLVAGLPWWRIVWLAFWKRRVEKAVVIGSILYIMAIAIAVLWDGWFSLHLPNPIAKLARQTRWSPNPSSTFSRGAIGRGGAQRSISWC